jgi:GT2 family glycosyltransferase
LTDRPAFPATPVSLAVSIVTYRSDLTLLGETLDGLAAAARHARAEGLLGSCMVRIADNSEDSAYAESLHPLLKRFEEAGSDFKTALLSGQGNVGYGAANNLALRDRDADVVLVLNPDVAMAPDALTAGLSVLRDQPGVGMVTPNASDAGGAPLPLAKSYPSVLVLFLRGFAPAFLRRPFARLLAQYDIALSTFDDSLSRPYLASGCFMLMRADIFRRAAGFDPQYFMYFEDFDLTMRTRRLARVAFVPAMRIVHHGGGAARKGWRHVWWFMRSAARFFNRHGWQWLSPAASGGTRP